LDEILRVVERAKHPVGMDVELAVVRLGEAAESLLVARPSRSDEPPFDRVGGSDGSLNRERRV
jgi:hypothetical protein